MLLKVLKCGLTIPTVGGCVYGCKSLGNGPVDASVTVNPSDPILTNSDSETYRDDSYVSSTSSWGMEQEVHPELVTEPTKAVPEVKQELVQTGLVDKLQGLTEEEKQVIRKEAEKQLKRLDEYTFRIFTPCGKGTAWILDYQLTEDGRYPTVWYIATAAHVLEQMRFGSNDYDQLLPKDMEETQYLRRKHKGIDYKGLSLHRGGTCSAVDWYGYNDISLATQATGEKFKQERGAVHMGEMKEPKLFFAAFNFLNENPEYGVKKDHYKDFAVLEIEFTSEEIAKRVTREFANKYTVESKDAINIFSKPIEERYNYDWAAINKNNENFYTLAYSKKRECDKYSHTKSWDHNKALGDQLSGSGGHKVKGFLPVGENAAKRQWGGAQYSKFGHWYLLRNFLLACGSSGGIHTDKEGNLIGVKSMIGGENNYLVTLRSSDFENKEAGLKSPKYDLIKGVDGQKFSYKSQVEKYKKNTWLKARNWEHKS